MKTKINFKIILIIIIVLLLVIIDQTIKINVYKKIYKSSVSVIDGCINLTYVENTGGAFGIGSNKTIFFIIVTVIIIGILIKVLLLKKDDIGINLIIAFSLIISGALGNLIDRFTRGFVIDYIDINPLFKYPMFNFADICIVIGIILLTFDLIKNREKL